MLFTQLSFHVARSSSLQVDTTLKEGLTDFVPWLLLPAPPLACSYSNGDVRWGNRNRDFQDLPKPSQTISSSVAPQSCQPCTRVLQPQPLPWI